MKKVIFSFAFLLACIAQALACDLCKSHQPEILQEVAHGMGPQGTTDYIILWSATAIVLLTLVFSIRFLVLPKKLDEKHQIKYLPINEKY